MKTSATTPVLRTSVIFSVALMLFGLAILAPKARAESESSDALGHAATSLTTPLGYQSLMADAKDSTAVNSDSSLAAVSANTTDGRDSDGTNPVVVVGGYQSVADTTLGKHAGKPDLRGNAPNPFRSSTAVTFVLAEPQQARLVVYDLLGRQVGVLADGALEAGSHTVSFSAEGLPSGVYLYRLETESGSVSRRMTLVR